MTVVSIPAAAADLILRALPDTVAAEHDPAYVAWFDELLTLVERSGNLPVAYAEYFDVSEGWEVGSGVRCPLPSEVRRSG